MPDQPTIPQADTVIMPDVQGINIAPDIMPVDIVQLTVAERLARIESTLNLT